MRASAKLCWVFCEFFNLPSNGVIAKIVLCFLELLFESLKLNINISETVRTSAKMHRRHFFSRFGYLPATDTIANVTSNDLDLLFQGKKLKL